MYVYNNALPGSLQLPEDVSDMGTVGPTPMTAAVKVGSDIAIGAAV